MSSPVRDERTVNRTNILQLAGERGFLDSMRFTIFVITASFAFLAGTIPLSAQDPAVVNAKTIKVKLENDKVRVLEAELPPGVKEQIHSHPANVIYVVAGGKFRNYSADGKAAGEIELKTGEVLYRDPLTHAAENIGSTTAHLILIELKSAAVR
jgi:quercetin dioxygenase-like cupin family protein